MCVPKNPHSLLLCTGERESNSEKAKNIFYCIYHAIHICERTNKRFVSMRRRYEALSYIFFMHISSVFAVCIVQTERIFVYMLYAILMCRLKNSTNKLLYRIIQSPGFSFVRWRRQLDSLPEENISTFHIYLTKRVFLFCQNCINYAGQTIFIYTNILFHVNSIDKKHDIQVFFASTTRPTKNIQSGNNASFKKKNRTFCFDLNSVEIGNHC